MDVVFRGLAKFWRTHVQRREPFLWHYGDHVAVALSAQERDGIPPTYLASDSKVYEGRYCERCTSLKGLSSGACQWARLTSAWVPQPSPLRRSPQVQFPECGTKPMAQFFWKCKGMVAHWQHAHKTKTIPAEFSEQLEISEKEKSDLVKFAKSSGA